MSSTPTTSAITTILNSKNRNPTLPPTVLHLSFTQRSDYFAVGTTSGFIIFDSDPFREVVHREFASLPTSSIIVGGGIGVIQMLFKGKITAIVGCGPTPQFTLNKVLIWDDYRSQCIAEFCFRSKVKSVRLWKDQIVVILLNKVYVYNFEDIELLRQIDTMSNPKGLCEISRESEKVLACLGLHQGEVRVEHCASKRTNMITAHDSNIACIALTHDGRFLATASSKGTLVRVFNTWDESLLYELRRGSGRAEIYSISFSMDVQWLAVSSDKATVHIFRLNVDSRAAAAEPNNFSPTSASFLSLITGIPKYLKSQWSETRFRLPQEGIRNIVTFGQQQKNTVIIIGVDGSYYRCQFDPEARGEMIQLQHYNFLHPEQNF
ncbi:autophagy-related 18a [Olea europaea subsp. europaea]|uniref:Autophagy-related 18a n=1 Tax=Olea europaea subsp. europaea TaxID=158383 RepID=A0A8S0RKP7_OLEEU|nr:autophagy-related 18a [Olea europaea subsp. europaea]